MKGYVAIVDDLGMWYCHKTNDINKDKYKDMYKHEYKSVVNNYCEFLNEENDTKRWWKQC